MHALHPHRPSRGARLRPLLGLLALVAVGIQSTPGSTPSQDDPRPEPVTVVCVRHAEKASEPGPDPSLSEAGRERAAALARMLEAAEVTHLFASPYQRTALTLEPLADATELEVERYDPQDTAGLRSRLAALPPGSVAVVAGHSNTVPALVRAFGVAPSGTRDSQWGELLDEADYDRAFLVAIDAEGRAVSDLELRYGD